MNKPLELLISAFVIVALGAVFMLTSMLALGFIGLGQTALPLGVTAAIFYSAGLAMWQLLGGTGSKVKRAQRAVDLVLTPCAVWLGALLANLVWPAVVGAGYVATPPEQAFWASVAVSLGAVAAYLRDTFGNGVKQAPLREAPRPRRR